MLGQLKPVYEQGAGTVGTLLALEPELPRTASICTPISAQAIQQVFKAYGLGVALDDSIRAPQVRLDLDDAGFEQATTY